MNLKKTIRNYIILAVGAFLLSKIYALFGHGVTSPWMSNLYLYLLGPGALAYFLISQLIPDIVWRKGYRLFYNTYNSGIAVLINGMLLYGVLEIAGGTSQIVPWFLYIGCGLLLTASVMFYRLVRIQACNIDK
jgi:hypothetical protein